MRVQNRHLSVLLTTFIFAMLSGCAGTPSASRASDFLQSKCERESGGLLSIEEFHKTDGRESVVMGVKFYSMAFEADVKFHEDARWFAEGVFAFNSFKAAKSQNGVMQMNFGVERQTDQVTPIVGTLVYAKSERGWNIDSLEMKLISRPEQKLKPLSQWVDGSGVLMLYKHEAPESYFVKVYYCEAGSGFDAIKVTRKGDEFVSDRAIYSWAGQELVDPQDVIGVKQLSKQNKENKKIVRLKFVGQNEVMLYGFHEDSVTYKKALREECSDLGTKLR